MSLKIEKMLVFLLAGATFTAQFALNAQMPSDEAVKTTLKQQKSIIESIANKPLKNLVAKEKDSLRLYNALKVADDIAAAKDYKLSPDAAFTYYTVPALSNIPRIGTQYPLDGKIGTTVDIVAARDEFEPASIVVYPFADSKDFLLKANDLKNAEGKIISSDKIDLKVVKVWYQNSNAWYNYFGDLSRKPVPELLLNDETLVKVDDATQDNYLRVDYPEGARYIWISAPEQIDPGFDSSKEPVYDAKTLKSVTLKSGDFKQFFVTINVASDAAPGIYTGNIDVLENNRKVSEIPVRLRVLDFVLPQPKTYYDINADFYTMLYCVPGSDQYYPANGYDKKLSDEKTRARFINQRNHNVTSPLYMGLWNAYRGYDEVVNSIDIAKKAGMKMDPFFEAFSCHATFGDPEKFLTAKYKAEIAKKELSSLLGHSNLWPAGGEEPGYGRIVGAREDWKMVHDLGMKVMCNGHDRRYFSGYSDDFRVGGGFANKEEADFMHQIGGKIGNYAGPHTGPENPDYMRRFHGINLYKKNYDMMYNYGYHEGGWNDFHTSTYRPMNLVYYTKDSVIDTLAWEGIREGIDDIRYATKLMTLAKEAVDSGETQKYYAGRKALQFLALLDEEKADLAAARQEMIRHILAISELLSKDKTK